MGKVYGLVENRYIVEVIGLVCVCDAGENEKRIYFWEQIGAVSMSDKGEWKSVMIIWNVDIMSGDVE